MLLTHTPSILGNAMCFGARVLGLHIQNRIKGDVNKILHLTNAGNCQEKYLLTWLSTATPRVKHWLVHLILAGPGATKRKSGRRFQKAWYKLPCCLRAVKLYTANQS